MFRTARMATPWAAHANATVSPAASTNVGSAFSLEYMTRSDPIASMSSVPPAFPSASPMAHARPSWIARSASVPSTMDASEQPMALSTANSCSRSISAIVERSCTTAHPMHTANAMTSTTPALNDSSWLRASSNCVEMNEQ